MKPAVRLECTLSFVEGKWVMHCGRENWRVEALDWETLKTKVHELVRARHPQSAVEVAYYFDMASIPKWFHQYQNHYFNGKLLIQP
ncbi:MAG: hypothetical protein GXO27_04080 [Chlorobi bacterium]|nr:hypothetical protein [Chlorobiota bacterium]